MIKGGLLSVLSPISVSILFRMIGAYKNTPLLGAEVLAGFLLFATNTGIIMAVFFNNGGVAWDNAKKYIETGMYGVREERRNKAATHWRHGR